MCFLSHKLKESGQPAGKVFGYPRTFLNDNTDNNDNGKNGRNCGCHEVTYNTDN